MFARMKILTLVLVCCCGTLLAGGDPSARLFRQPTAKEIERVIASIKNDTRRPDSLVVISASLKEPPKQQLLNDPASLVREISVMVRDKQTRRLHLVSGNAATGAITEWMRVDAELQSLNADDAVAGELIVRAHKGWLAGLKRRGIDSSTVAISIWPSGIPKTSFNTRIVRCLAWVMTNGVNLFDRPIEGLICTVNLDQKRVIEFYDRDVAPVAKPALWPKKRTATRSTPTASIKIDGNTVTWNKWTFDATLRDREGLVISRLRWNDGTTLRSVAHSLALSEVVMANADTSGYWYWRNAFIVGEFGMGRTAAPLVPGVDVAPSARLLDAVVVGPNTTLRTINGAIGLYERGTDLVVTQKSAVNNFIYQLSYILSADGAITVDLGIGGTPFVKGVVDSVARAGSPTGQSTGRLLAKNIVAPFLQHFVNVRCDLDVDGPKNIVSEVEYEKPLAEDDPYHNAVEIDDYEFRFENEAVRTEAPERLRRWRVASASTRSEIGQRPSYVLIPTHPQPAFLQAPNLMMQRAPFMQKTFMCTQFDPNEQYASGKYPMQSSGASDISEYVADNASIYRKDVVLWYTMAVLTAPRPEDWPVMNLQHVSFSLVPDGFVRSLPPSGSPR